MKFLRPSRATEWRPRVAHGKTVGFGVKAGLALEQGERNIQQSIFCHPFRGLKFFFAIRQSTVLPWATFARASGAALAAMLLFCATSATAETANTLSNAEIQGRNLVQQLLDHTQTTNFIQTGVFKIKRAKLNETNFTIRCEGIVTPTNWSTIYIFNYPTNEDIFGTNSKATILEVDHAQDQPNKYEFNDGACRGYELKGSDTYISFAGSDFWLCDLGLEFFHWPQQKVLPKTTNLKRGREYTLLESTNPNPSTNSYSRVLTCIDKETGGILEAEAYDTKGEVLKVFEPKSFKKVNGQWQLQEMEIRNVQTGSRTRLEFDLNK
jgi:Outer membrane lipoprotein-sorting protein